MKAAIRSAVPILVVTVVATGVGLLSGATMDQTGSFPVISALFAAMVGLIGWIQKWQLVPWLPTLGVVVAAVGYLLNDPTWVNLAMLASGLTVVWHSLQEERRHRRNNAPAH